jgi:hypothetical protein
MKLLRILSTVGLATAALALSSCNLPMGGSGLAAYQSYDRPAKLPKNPSAVRVKVSLSKQRVYVMEGSNPLLVMPVSVGAPGTSTPSGSFTIFNKEAKYRANTHGYAYSGNQVKKTMLAKKPSARFVVMSPRAYSPAEWFTCWWPPLNSRPTRR